jgi:signal transduction histidine kinase
VIFISALSDIDSVLKGFEAGGADYIVKPFQFREVLARVTSQLTLVQQRKQIETLRAQDKQHFESLQRMKDQFIRMATHDLRNPLNVILGYANMMERLNTSDRDLPLRDQAIENIRQSVDKMRGLVSDLLDFAHFEAGTFLTLAPVPLSQFIDKCLVGLHIVATEKHIELAYTAAPQDVTINVDENYMARVIDNLVSNAIKYTPSGGRVEVRAELSEHQIISIQVTDNGMGIPEEELPFIFDAFYRVRQTGHEQVEGSGLGLSIVKTVVEQHHGQVTVQSTPGMGSTFCVTLPVMQAAPQAAPQPARQAATSP